MKRVVKLLKRQTTSNSNHSVPVNGQQQQQQHKQQQQQQQLVPIIPVSVLVDWILPLLDRVTQNRLCATCKEIYRTGRQRQQSICFQWPNVKFRLGRPVVAVSFSPAGNSLAVVVGNSRKISIWNRRRGQCQKLVGHSGIVSNVNFAPISGNDSNKQELLASCSRTDGTIRLWTPGDGEAYGDDDNKIKFTCLRILNIRVFGLKYILFSPASTEIASWGYDGSIRLNATEDARFYGSTNWRNKLGLQCFNTVAFSKQQRGLMAHSFNNEKVRLWNSETQNTTELFDQDQRVATDYAAFVTSIAFIPDAAAPNKEYLVVGCRVAKLKFWDLSNFTCIRTIQLGSGWSGVTHLVVSADGCYVSCTGQGSQIRVFRVSDGVNVATYTEHRDRVQSMSGAPDGTIASGGCDRMLRLQNIHDSLPQAPRI